MVQILPDITPSRASPGRQVEFKTDDAEFGDGYIQSTVPGLNNRKLSWNLLWQNYPVSEIDQLTQFFDNHAGATPFQWQAPNDVVRFWRCRGYSVKENGPNVSTLSATFEQWFGAVS